MHIFEVVVYASGEYTFVHSHIVPNERLSLPHKDDLLSWNCNAYTSIAGQVVDGKVCGWNAVRRAPAPKRCKARCN